MKLRPAGLAAPPADMTPLSDVRGVLLPPEAMQTAQAGQSGHMRVLEQDQHIWQGEQQPLWQARAPGSGTLCTMRALQCSWLRPGAPLLRISALPPASRLTSPDRGATVSRLKGLARDTPEAVTGA